VFFYSGETELTQKIGRYLLDVIRQGGAAITISGRPHRLAVAGYLVQAGIDLPTARASGAYSELDASETLAKIIVADNADAAGFWSEITPVIRRAAGLGQPVRIFGEMVSLLWEAGQAGAAIEVEAMWNELGVQFPFSLVCAYPIESVIGDGHFDPLTEVCRAHSAIAGDPPTSMRGWRY
jgi:hypothetical protein